MVDASGEVIKIVDRTNPNKKWDWYQVGGRWTGYFKLKPKAITAAGAECTNYQEPTLGRPGIQTMNADYEPPTSDRADSVQKRFIDFEGMRNEAGDEAAKNYDLFKRVTNNAPMISWDDILKEYTEGDKTDIDSARKEYHNQPGIIAIRANEETKFWFEVIDDYIISTRGNASFKAHGMEPLPLLPCFTMANGT